MCRSDASRAAGIVVWLLVASTLVACAAPSRPPGAVTDLKPAERPAPNSVEAGMWMQVEVTEAQLRTSGALVRDPALRAYVQGIACRVAGQHCASIRVYVVRDGAFYASMAPNGMVKVGTGLLLRVANEAQLAYVFGHEIGHYLRRHSLQRWEDVKAKSANLDVERASIAAFSRDNEREADHIGYELLVRAGYDPREAPRAWERLLLEASARPSMPNPFFATHPTGSERLATLRDYAETVVVADGAELRTGREEYLAQLHRIRRWLLDDEVHRRQFRSSESLLRRLIEDGDGLAELHFYVGEIHRLRGTEEDLPKATEAYRRALELPAAPPEAWRSLGIVYVRTGDPAAARDAFTRYLELAPDAEDRDLIKNQIVDLQAAP